MTRKTRREPKRGALDVKIVFAAKRTLAIKAPSLEGVHRSFNASSSMVNGGGTRWSSTIQEMFQFFYTLGVWDVKVHEFVQMSVVAVDFGLFLLNVRLLP